MVRGVDGANQGGSSLRSLLRILGPQYESQYQLAIADAIIDALMEANRGGGKGGRSQRDQQTQQAQQTQPMQSTGLGPEFYRIFNASPQALQALTSTIVGGRGAVMR